MKQLYILLMLTFLCSCGGSNGNDKDDNESGPQAVVWGEGDWDNNEWE
ncbi:hypothetical protein ACJJI4_14530 [Microbulbifer sp. TRSA002]